MRASQSALLASIATNADAAREMVAANNLPGATAVLEQIAANARDVAAALLQAQANEVAVQS